MRTIPMLLVVVVTVFSTASARANILARTKHSPLFLLNKGSAFISRFFLWLLLACFASTAEAASVSWDGDAGDGLWSTPANWSDDTLPHSADTISISGAVGEILLDVDFMLTGVLHVSDGATVRVNNAVTLILDSSLLPAHIRDSIFVGNNGTLINDGVLQGLAGGSLGLPRIFADNLGVFVNNNTTNDLLFLLRGTLENNGGMNTVRIAALGGTVTNNGLIDDAKLDLQVTGFTNNVAGTINLTPTFVGNTRFLSTTIFDNHGTVTNAAAVLNESTFNNFGTFDNRNGTFQNDGTFSSECGSILLGGISGNPPIVGDADGDGVPDDCDPLVVGPVLDLGTLGGSLSSATSISDLGDVVGLSTTVAGGFFHAFLWNESAGMSDLGTLGGISSSASAINDRGVVVGSSSIATGQSHAFRWTAAGGMVDLGTLPGGESSSANDVNDLDQIVGSSSTVGNATPRAFLWQNGQMTNLGTLGGTRNSEAHGINNRSQVVGISQNAAGEFHAFLLTPEDTDGDGHPDLWSRDSNADGANDLMLDLGTIDLPDSQALAVNDLGQVTGFTRDISTGDVHAFVWTAAGGMQDLGSLGGTSRFARGNNNFDHIVGVADDASGAEAAFFWMQETGLVNLAPFVGGPSSANDINMRAQVVGRATTATGETHAFLVQIDFPQNTAPGALVDIVPVDTATGESPVQVTFDEVTQAGDTELTLLSDGFTPPAGFLVGDPPLVFDLQTTAQFSGPITVCVSYDESTFSDEGSVRLLHSSDGVNWTDVTSSVDTINNVVCGTVTSFSLLGVFESFDDDGDGVPNADDVCPGFDDNIDINGNGIPDGCDGAFQLAKLTADDAVAHDTFGRTVAVSGDTVVVGAFPFEDDHATDRLGGAYVFVGSGTSWTQQAKLTGSDAVGADGFGASVTISGDTLVVGAPQLFNGPGAVYVFVRTGETWTQQAKLTAGDGATGDLFGASVSIDGDTLVVGAEHNHDVSFGSGAAYVFVRTGETWTQRAKLSGSSPSQSNARRGTSVSISGDTVLVGALADAELGYQTGAVFVFEKPDGGWVDMNETAKLTASDAVEGDHFGLRCALDGNTAVVGAIQANSRSGKAYVFERSGETWTERAILTALDAAPDGIFGFGVGINADTVVVGSGRASYMFQRGSGDWSAQHTFTGCDSLPNDGFGPIAVSGDIIVVGAKVDDDAGDSSGSAYLFSVTIETDSDGDGVPDGCDTCLGFDDNIDSDGDGVPDGCDACPGFDDRIDADGDGIPDACDDCPLDPDNDIDGDGICGDVDICPTLPNTDDTDGDGIWDVVDADPCNPSIAFSDAPNAEIVGSVDMPGGGTPASVGASIQDAEFSDQGVLVVTGPVDPLTLIFSCPGIVIDPVNGPTPTILEYTVVQAPNSSVIYTCGTLTIEVEEGSASVEFTIDDVEHELVIEGGGTVTLENTVDELEEPLAVTVTTDPEASPGSVIVDGQEATPGQTANVLSVEIDIKPGTFPNTINLGSHGSVPVAILSRPGFNATLIDPLTVRLSGAEVNVRGNGTPQASEEDVNGDGLLDLVVHVSTEALDLIAEDTEASLSASASNGETDTIIRGIDTIRVVP